MCYILLLKKKKTGQVINAFVRIKNRIMHSIIIIQIDIHLLIFK